MVTPARYKAGVARGYTRLSFTLFSSVLKVPFGVFSLLCNASMHIRCWKEEIKYEYEKHRHKVWSIHRWRLARVVGGVTVTACPPSSIDGG